MKYIEDNKNIYVKFLDENSEEKTWIKGKIIFDYIGSEFQISEPYSSNYQNKQITFLCILDKDEQTHHIPAPKINIISLTEYEKK